MKLHIKTFNPLFWILLLLTIILAVLYKLFFIRFGVFSAKILFLILYVIMFSFFFYYKIKLCKDKEHIEFCINHNIPKPVLLAEILPLHLCNIAYLIVPIGILFDNNACIGFGLLMAPPSAIMSLFTPYPGLSEGSLLKPTIAGYYLTHLFILFMSLITWLTKEFVLDYKLAFEVFIVIVVSSIIAHIVNLILIKKCNCPDANYFFTINPNVSEITKFFYKLIPVQWLYEMPIFIILWLLFNIVVFIYRLF